MFDDAFNYTKEEILEHSLQEPTPKKYPHGNRYEVSLSLSPRNKAAITCRPDPADGACQDFNFRILDYDADAFNYIDGYIETNQSFSMISGDVPCQDTEPMIDWLTKTIKCNAGSFSDADNAYICSLGPVGPTRIQMSFVGLGSQLCEDMRQQLLDDCAKSTRLGNTTRYLGNSAWPIVYNTFGFTGIALGFWAVNKCIKKSGKKGQYIEVPKAEG
ncbi:MAG: hypothetical protein AB8G05_09330 [Oligoflexales bacterium]